MNISFAASLFLLDFVDLSKSELFSKEIMNGVDLFILLLVVSELPGEHDVVSVLAVWLSDFVGWQLFVLVGHAIILNKFEHVVISLVEKDKVLEVKSWNVLSLEADV